MAQNLAYTRCGDYLIPDIQLSHTSDKPLGKYGRMRRVFLAENNAIRAYIQNQLEEDKMSDQISIKEYIDPFTGTKNPKA